MLAENKKKDILSTLFILPPIREDVGNSGGVCESVDIFKVLFSDLKRPSRDVGNVFANQLARVNSGFIDLFEQE